jgi:hypothetical protein
MRKLDVWGWEKTRKGTKVGNDECGGGSSSQLGGVVGPRNGKI